MKALDVDRVEVCPWALREGMILRYLQTTVDTSQYLPPHPITPHSEREGAMVRVLTQTP
jgi:exopolyphosphatase/guanosine-5'-triphosphate,3'-diphosphate pyrophosphatase